MYISIVIPFKDEAERLSNSLQKLDSYLHSQQHDYEVILVDDGSTDGTVEKIQYYLNQPAYRLLRHTQNQGKGAALQTGIMQAHGKYILMSDADFSTPIQEVEKLQDYIYRGFDMVIGSRALPGSTIIKKQPFYRRLLGKAGNFVIRFVLGLPYKDTQCGFKLFKRDVAQSLFSDLTMKRWSFDFEVLYKAKKRGYTVKELGVIWENDESSHVRVLHDSLGTLLDVFKIRFGK